MVTRSEIRVAGLASGTDKIANHAYERFYADFLAGFDGNGSIVEIGYGNGESVNFWKALYPSAFLYVIDRDVELEGNGFKVLKCDQSLICQLVELRDFLQDKDVALILDDGSHIPEHQLATFNTLFGVLRQGGAYIIEDTECSYWRHGSLYGYKTRYGLKSGRSLINIMTLLPHWINRRYLTRRERIGFARLLQRKGLDFNLAALESIGRISFADNCLAIFKCLDGDEQYASRDYRLSDSFEPALIKYFKSFLPAILVGPC